jgi:hypothetical protein
VLQDHYAHSGHYNQKYHVDELLQIRNQALGLVPQKLEIWIFYPSLVPFCERYLELKIGIPESACKIICDQLGHAILWRNQVQLGVSNKSLAETQEFRRISHIKQGHDSDKLKDINQLPDTRHREAKEDA